MSAAVDTANADVRIGSTDHANTIIPFDAVSASPTTISAIYDHSFIDHFQNSSLIVCNSDMRIESG